MDVLRKARLALARLPHSISVAENVQETRDSEAATATFSSLSGCLAYMMQGLYTSHWRMRVMVALVRLAGQAGGRCEEVPREARPETPIRPKGRDF